jgi:hypothetical protein
VGKWALKLAEMTAAPPTGGTDKTAKRGDVSVLAVPPTGGESDCPAHEWPARVASKRRPYRLTKAEGDAAHAEPWDDAVCGCFVARVALFMRRGINATDADDLAERLHLRDVQGDDRGMCLECARLDRRGRCLAAAGGEVLGVDRRLEPVPTVLLRCEAFEPRKELA